MTAKGHSGMNFSWPLVTVFNKVIFMTMFRIRTEWKQGGEDSRLKKEPKHNNKNSDLIFLYLDIHCFKQWVYQHICLIHSFISGKYSQNIE